MKKITAAIVLMLSLGLVFCAACSKNDAGTAQVSATMAPTPTPTAESTPTPEPTETPEPSATPEPTEAPEETVRPTEAPAANTGGGATSQATDAPAAEPTEAPEEPPQDKRAVAQSMIGQSVSALTSAIGAPSSSLYTESCLVMNGEDGLLEYDGFSVSTVRYADGSELILGVY